MKKVLYALMVSGFLLILPGCSSKLPATHIERDFLNWDRFSHYVESFNATDDELYKQYITNAEAGDFLKNNIPYFECPDQEIEQIYYFRWWTYRKHIKKTPDGFVITEFLPQVPWSGKYNTISCPAGHHFYEGRWLHQSEYLKDYALFWFQGGGNPRLYSFWAADAIYHYLLVHPDSVLRNKMLPYLQDNLDVWKKERKDAGEKLYWQYDSQDGMEVMVSGALMNGKQVFTTPSLRPTINSYMYGDLKAMSAMERESGLTVLADSHEKEAEELRTEVMDRLWSSELNFFRCLPHTSELDTAMVRELIGFVPWYFNLPADGKGYEVAWAQLKDSLGFKAQYGPTTVEQRHPGFILSDEWVECQWNGPSWPFATTQTLKAMANLLRNYDQEIITKADYLELLKTYTHSHWRQRADGENVPWIDENLNPYTGEWIARSRLKKWANGTWSADKGGVERGKDYNHSGYCDLVISDLIGVNVEGANRINLHPLITADTWSWFCLDHLKIRNHRVTIIWDQSGEKYHNGTGLMVYVDGKLTIHQPDLSSVVIKL
ncbi:hypothetical protein DMA11_21045 [Marinilabiliaceae bacterium JC017]|nr:hypothetical protein DMA11_21045 [Marinilabiliaceae bacterium JC017]